MTHLMSNTQAMLLGKYPPKERQVPCQNEPDETQSNFFVFNAHNEARVRPTRSFGCPRPSVVVFSHLGMRGPWDGMRKKK
jgi:hypothetical protein